MHSEFSQEFRQTSDAEVAEAILLRCVHCGFCNATCPTYQVLGDELDGPRGRIYLIKQVLEGQEVSAQTQLHFDRCLSCRSCETTCPSGVNYHRLIDIGREAIAQKTSRSLLQRGLRRALSALLPYPKRFTLLMQFGRLVRPILPTVLKAKIPRKQTIEAWPEPRHARRILLLHGCVQPGLAPHIDAHIARVLDHLGISALSVTNAGCCGALNLHLGDKQSAKTWMRNLIDQCWPFIEHGVEAIVMSASGCVSMLKDYHELLHDDPAYAVKAQVFSKRCKDLSEVLQTEDFSQFDIMPRKIAFHSPCSLQHGQQLPGIVEALLNRCGFELTYVADAHLCCGSAGTYSLLQPKLATQLRMNKLNNLLQGQPEWIATANIGCLLHLQEKSTLPVVHWIELFKLPKA